MSSIEDLMAFSCHILDEIRHMRRNYFSTDEKLLKND
jgi:hypothetical protein